MGRAGLPRRAGAGLALQAPRRELGRDDESAQAASRETGRDLLPPHPRTRPQAGRGRHHAEVPLAAARWRAHRERAHPRQPRALRRGQRPPHAVRLHAGGLCLRLQVLRERPRRMEAQPRAGGNRGAGIGHGENREFGVASSESARRGSGSTQNAEPKTRNPPREQPRHHGHGRAVGELRPLVESPPPAERAVGRRHRRTEDHHLHQRTRAADSQARGRAGAVPPGHLPARRDGRGAHPHHAGEPQASAGRTGGCAGGLPAPERPAHHLRIHPHRRRERRPRSGQAARRPRHAPAREGEPDSLQHGGRPRMVAPGRSRVRSLPRRAGAARCHRDAAAREGWRY